MEICQQTWCHDINRASSTVALFGPVLWVWKVKILVQFPGNGQQSHTYSQIFPLCSLIENWRHKTIEENKGQAKMVQLLGLKEKTKPNKKFSLQPIINPTSRVSLWRNAKVMFHSLFWSKTSTHQLVNYKIDVNVAIHSCQNVGSMMKRFIWSRNWTVAVFVVIIPEM